MDADTSTEVEDSGIGSEFIISYYRERYEETKSNYRRLEDKVNYLLAVLGVEVSALLTIFGSLELNKSFGKEIFYQLAVLFLCACVLSVVFCFYYLWHAWGLRPVPYMPTHKKPVEHDFLFNGDKEIILRYHMIQYGEAVSQIEELHKGKAIYVRSLFNYVALSFGFFILSVTFLLISKA